jgi:cyanophycinase
MVWGVFLTGCMIVSAIVLQQARSMAVLDDHAILFDARVSGGSLMIVGGGMVPVEIRRQFVELAGGSKARIVVVPASEPRPGDEDRWLAPFRKIGPESVVLLHAECRAAADGADFRAPLREATGVWFGGGNQTLLAERYVDSPVESDLHDVLRRNGAVGGNSAGAAILSRVMIAGGDLEPTEARGLGLIPDAIVDQHFLRRNRMWRLQQLLEYHPDLVGIGVDEHTALIVNIATNRLRVVGNSYVVVCVPGENERSMRLEVLKSSDDTTLARLRVEHIPYQPIADWDEVLTGG